MAIRNILTLGEETLRKKSRPVTDFNEKLGALLDDMLETMHEANGVGLAAPQVGLLRRAVVIDIGEGPIELVNPVIVETSGRQAFEEGCLSVPGKRGLTHRPERTVVEAQDRHGNPIRVEGEGRLSVALCHEIDHLDGKLYVDIVEGELMEEE